LAQAARNPGLPVGALADPLTWFEAAVAIGHSYDEPSPPVGEPVAPVGEPVTPVGDPEDVVDRITDEDNMPRCSFCGEDVLRCVAARLVRYHPRGWRGLTADVADPVIARRPPRRAVSRSGW